MVNRLESLNYSEGDTYHGAVPGAPGSESVDQTSSLPSDSFTPVSLHRSKKYDSCGCGTPLSCDCFREWWTIVSRAGPGPGCGAQFLKFVCENEKILWRVKHECGRKDCPDCGPKWVRRESAYATERILKNRTGGHLRHAIISPKMDWNPCERELRDARVKLRRLLRAEGWTGACSIYHPYRDSAENEHYDVVGGHFHVVGWKRHVPHDYDPGPWGGWIYKNLKVRTLRPVIHYDLDHAGVHDGLHSITWLVDLAYNKIPSDRVLGDRDGLVCPSCGHLLRSYWSWVRELTDDGFRLHRYGYRERDLDGTTEANDHG